MESVSRPDRCQSILSENTANITLKVYDIDLLLKGYSNRDAAYSNRDAAFTSTERKNKKMKFCGISVPMTDEIENDEVGPANLKFASPTAESSPNTSEVEARAGSRLKQLSTSKLMVKNKECPLLRNGRKSSLYLYDYLSTDYNPIEEKDGAPNETREKMNVCNYVPAFLSHCQLKHKELHCLYCNLNFVSQKDLLSSKHADNCLIVRPDEQKEFLDEISTAELNMPNVLKDEDYPKDLSDYNEELRQEVINYWGLIKTKKSTCWIMFTIINGTKSMETLN
uniref:Uncharacterized protein n=1 Tax=Romanomermis culicivorax TaxID=13658 RepID=A0A915J8S6_ROMCU